MLKKGAMFGLDARIALAIFGALSVISGAALYSAIKESKVVSTATDIIEITKAFEAYYLDVGPALQLMDALNYESAELVKSTKPGWKGPYLSYPIAQRYASVPQYKDKTLDFTRFPNTVIHFTKLPSTAATATSGSNPGTCTTDDDCAIYVTIQQYAPNTDMKNLASEIDRKYDGDNNLGKGTVRGLLHPSGHYYLFYKILDYKLYK